MYKAKDRIQNLFKGFSVWRKMIMTIFVSFSLLCIGNRVHAQINAEQVIEIGRNALYFDDYVVAIQYFNQAIGSKPYLAKPYFYRAVAKLNLEDFHGADQDASKAIELNEFITDAWQIRAIARQQLGDNEGAIGDYEHALMLIPRNKQMMFNLARAYSDVKNFEKADSLFSNILSYYPGFEEAFLGRADMFLSNGDTLRALNDLDSALVINPQSYYANVRRAEVLMNRERPLYLNALVNMDQAIKLEPKLAPLYINRSVIKYHLNDWWGAKEDLDHVLALDPDNDIARLNRALLNLEANSNDQAQEDLTIILKKDPDNYRARYNRALVQYRKHNYKGAIDDLSLVLKRFPDYAAGYLWRAEIEQQRGNYKGAQADFERAQAISKRQGARKKIVVDLPDDPGQKMKDSEPELTAEQLTEKEFARLLTVEDNNDLRMDYTSSATRGRIQDVNSKIEPEPLVELSYYTAPTELNENSYFIREIDDLNKTGQLRFLVFATVNPPAVNDEDAINKHMASINYYNSYLATHEPRVIDYIGRAMDFITVKNYDSAIKDIDRAIALNPTFAPSYMLRAQSNLRLYKAHLYGDVAVPGSDSKIDSMTRQSLARKRQDDILSDLDKAIELAPTSPYVYYNKAVALMEFGLMTEALPLLNKTLELNPNFASAYYNRGYVLLENGQREKGIADLSHAGELGVVSAYNLIKRISR